MCLVSFQNLSSYYPVNKNKWDPLDTLLKQSPHQPSVVAFSTPCSIFHILEHCNATRLAQKRFKCRFLFNSICCTVMESWCVIYSGSRLQGIEKTWVLDNGPFHPQTCRSTFLGLETSYFLVMYATAFITPGYQFSSQVLQKNLPLSDCRWK